MIPRANGCSDVLRKFRTDSTLKISISMEHNFMT